jgi:hypothetical protein
VNVHDAVFFLGGRWYNWSIYLKDKNDTEAIIYGYCWNCEDSDVDSNTDSSEVEPTDSEEPEEAEEVNPDFDKNIGTK